MGGGRQGDAARLFDETVEGLRVQVNRHVVDDGRDGRPEAHGNEEREVGAADHGAARTRSDHHEKDDGPEADHGEFKNVAQLWEGRTRHLGEGPIVDFGS